MAEHFFGGEGGGRGGEGGEGEGRGGEERSAKDHVLQTVHLRANNSQGLFTD